MRNSIPSQSKIKFLLTALFLFFGANSFLQENKGSVEVFIIDANTRDSISFATVKIINDAGASTMSTMNNSGIYTFNNVLKGEYKLNIKASGYQSVSSQPVVIKANANTIVKIELKKQLVKEVVLDSEDEVEEYKPHPSTNSGRKIKKSYNSGGALSSGYTTQSPNYNTEAYSAINENGFKSSKINPLSTFSIDVDAASYSNMRRFIVNGNKVPVDAVRVEEMINYFNYDYAEPSGKDPFSITTEIGNTPWNPKSKLVHIGLQAKKIERDDLPPSNIVFLLDVSGSMNANNKLPLLKKSFQLLVNELGEKDRIAIVVYAGASGIVLKSTSADQKTIILEALDGLSAGGSTAGGKGIELAYKVATANFIKGGNNRVILATDGDFNIGMSSDGEMQRLIEKKRESGVFLTCLGFGMGNYKDSKMETLADKGNGNYAYIDNLLEAKKVLVTEIGGTLLTVAKDVKIQVEFNPNVVESYRLVGYENRLLNEEDFNDDKKDAGEIGAGHSVTALYEVILRGTNDTLNPSIDELRYQTIDPNNAAYGAEMFTVKFRYKQPDSDVSELIVRNVKNKRTKNNQLSSDFLFSACIAEFGMLLRDSKFKGNSSFDSVLKMAINNKGEDRNGYRAEFIRIVELAKKIYAK